MSDDSTHERAAQARLHAFARQPGADLRLALHAALPVALSPDLLHLIRINFLLDENDPPAFVAEADLLLSPLCTEIDDGLYEIDHQVRDILLRDLARDYGQPRLRDLAALLWQYSHSSLTWAGRPGLERAQQFTALTILDPARAEQWLAEAAAQAGPNAAVEQEWFVVMNRVREAAADVMRVDTDAPEPPATEETFPRAMPASLTILVVDDEQAIREMLRIFLEDEGYQVVEAEDGLVALQLARQLRPTLVILDSRMPRMDGYETLRQIRSDPTIRDIPVILMSSRPDYFRKAIDRPNAILGKPFDFEEFTNSVRNLIGAPQQPKVNVGEQEGERLTEMLLALKQASSDTRRLESALLGFHAVLEDHFRSILASNPRVPDARRAALYQPNNVNWKELLDLMQHYGGLSGQDRALIWRMNGIRNNIAHGLKGNISRIEVERYAELTKKLLGHTPPPTPNHDDAIVPIETDSNTLLQRGIDAAREGRSDEAHGLFAKLTQLQPDNAQAWLWLGNINSELARYEDALRAFQQGILLDPKNTQLHDGLGKIYGVLRQYQQAIEAYQESVALESNNAHAFNRLGDMYVKVKQYSEAMIAYQKAIALDSENVYSLNGIAEVYLYQSRFDEAIQFYQRALQLDPLNVYAYNGLGDVYNGMRLYRRAVSAFERALELDPSNVYSYNGRGHAYMAQKLYDKAVSDFERALELDPSNVYAYNGLGDTYMGHKLHDKAISAYERALELDPSNVYAYNGLGNVYAEQNQAERAIAAYQRALKIDPNNHKTHRRLRAMGFEPPEEAQPDEATAPEASQFSFFATETDPQLSEAAESQVTSADANTSVPPEQPSDVKGFELFRRAVVEGDKDARAAVERDYRPLLLQWARQTQSADTDATQDEEIVDRALGRAWPALTPERFASFQNLAAVLAYLRTIVKSATMDARRESTSPRFSRTSLEQLATHIGATEQERIVLDETFNLGLSPREILGSHPKHFANVGNVYQVKRNLLSRLTRSGITLPALTSDAAPDSEEHPPPDDTKQTGKEVAPPERATEPAIETSYFSEEASPGFTEDFTAQLDSSIDNQAVLKAIDTYWQAILSNEDRQIMALRVRDVSFEDIAERLGLGWSEAAAQQRYQQIIDRTREYLRQQGLIDQG